MEITYLSDLVVKPLDNGKDWELLEDLYLDLPIIYFQVIDAGFIFDFASIPKIFQLFVAPATGKYRKPALVHDYLYRSKICNRKIADEIFLTLMKYAGVNYFKRHTIYLAVRTGGWVAYNKKRGINNA